ncbi:hypothetical protein, partial [Tsukamurella paurometabola]
LDLLALVKVRRARGGILGRSVVPGTALVRSERGGGEVEGEGHDRDVDVAVQIGSAACRDREVILG